MQGQRQGSTGSIGHVAHCILRVALRRVAVIAVAVAGITVTIAGTALTITFYDHPLEA